VLSKDVRRDLEGLSPVTRDRVERFLAAAWNTIEDDPATAYAYAKEAGRIGGRSAVVREAVGVAAYHAEDFKAARTELQAARRISGRDDIVPLLADCERALGKPHKAIELASEPGARALRGQAQAELLLVLSGARADLDQLDAAAAVLRGPAAQTPANAPWAARIYYGYADALLAKGDSESARDWFLKSLNSDEEGETDADERIIEIDSASE